ncbi:MAG: eukaryotic translation initiation factor 3 subunit E [Flavobacteriaceae bacterium]|nr:eukaryotic translation initiation factor 3 subunit E [Flavobacteriaceae bacterium]
MKNLFYLSIFILLFSCKKTQTPNQDYLGVVDIVITGNEVAQPFFEKGLLLLHSFEYEDARDEFQKAINSDKNMAMAYWGKAMTYNHGLWSQQNFEEATATLNKLKNIENINPLTELEQDFINAVRILYSANKAKKRKRSGLCRLYEKIKFKIS